MFWGDRMSALNDPFGHNWNLTTFKRQVDPAEMQRAMKEQFGAAMGEAGKGKKKATKSSLQRTMPAEQCSRVLGAGDALARPYLKNRLMRAAAARSSTMVTSTSSAFSGQLHTK